MFNELVNTLIDGESCILDFVGKNFHITKQLEDYRISVDDNCVYIMDEDDRYVFGSQLESIDKEVEDGSPAYVLSYGESEIYIAFPLLENI